MILSDNVLLRKLARAKEHKSDSSWLNEAHHEPTAVYREIEPMMRQLEAGPSSVGRGKPDTDPGTGPDPPQGAKPDTAHDFKLERYYPGKKDHHKRVTTERPHPAGVGPPPGRTRKG